jgi:diazepam-binding inhibitor (GABA receptor modulating acyl-CoA-binding protein)
MTDLDARFEQAAAAAKNLSERPDNDTLLQLYALYKQGSAGDVAGARPALFDFVAGAKYDAWERLKGMPPEAAQEQYVNLVISLGGAVDD